MATKTISIDLEAYERLDQARRTPSESFSRVIKRATWPKAKKTAGQFLEEARKLPPLDRKTLERLELVLKGDKPPEDPWKE